ncbi:MAG: tetratricopeptide repeat protein [Proteobacteria bacterium]|nr:tetratricopeptide repeat protein [Pseudomonadota bacterium]MBU4472453.1 tetratricopeptide repeat protein [Pseudomonadota bacterium]MCG2751280.1 tetratricopeptide repeat protein [Desulfobacteraceae bacterium]
MRSFVIIAALLCLSGCSLLGIHILQDSLTAAQHSDLGYTYEKQNKLELAEKEYLKALKKDKALAVPCFNLGNVYYKMGKPDQAVKYYRLGLKKASDQSDQSDIMNNLAFVLMEQGNYAEAHKWVEKAIAIAPKPEYLDTREKILNRLK